MAIGFNQTKGSAIKNNMNQFKPQDGDNEVRLVGDVLARYVYWVKGENNKDIPMECLSFDRQEEKFTNKEKDWVREFYPDLKCGWSYVMQCIHGGELKVYNLTKKLFEQIVTAAEDLGDPTDPDTGWDVKFKRVKTGNQKWNVEYQLQVLKCKPHALTDEERELIVDLKSMDVIMPRPTPDAQKELLDRFRDAASKAENTDDEALEEEFNVG